jgi:glycosyltransferase involved in cell wall biosynthesis
MPCITVIIPTYNRREYLKEAVDSVLAQKFTDFELFVIDDGSADKTADLVEKYTDPRVKYFFQEKRGVSAARNRGITGAAGEYISFLDSDDLWKKDKLSIQVSFMMEKKSLISYTDEIWIRNSVRVNPMKKHKKYSGRIYEKCLPLCIISPSSVMIKRELFDEVGLFDEELPVCEDYDMWLRIASRYPVGFIDKKLIIKRGGHADQLSRRSWGNDQYRVKALLKMLETNHLDRRLRSLTEKELLKKCEILAKGHVKRGKLEEGNHYKTLMEVFGKKGEL